MSEFELTSVGALQALFLEVLASPDAARAFVQGRKPSPVQAEDEYFVLLLDKDENLYRVYPVFKCSRCGYWSDDCEGLPLAYIYPDDYPDDGEKWAVEVEEGSMENFRPHARLCDKCGSFRRGLASLLNQHSKENGSNTPDFLLAKYLHRCLDLYDETTQQRDAFYGVNLAPGDVRMLNPEEQEFKKLVCRFMGRKFREELAKEICAVQPMHDAGEALAMIDKLLGEAGPNAAIVATMGRPKEDDDGKT